MKRAERFLTLVFKYGLKDIVTAAADEGVVKWLISTFLDCY